MSEPCKQCGMRIRKNETWHDERHYYSQDLGMVVIIRREPNEKPVAPGRRSDFK